MKEAHSLVDATEDGAATLRGIGLVLLAMLLFASMDGVNKHLVVSYSIIQILWVRYLLFFAFALLVARRQGGIRATLASGQPGLQIARSLLLIAEQAAFVIAFVYLPLADVHAIAAVSPLIVTALSAPLLRERVGMHRLIAVGAGFAGVLVIMRPGMGVMSNAAAIPLIAAVLFAVYQMMTRLVSRTDSSETTVLYSSMVGVVVVSLLGPFSWQAPTQADWGLLILVAVLGSTAHFSLIKALQLAAASALQPFNYSLFLWAVVVGFVGFGDFPDAWTLAGATLIIASNLYVVQRTRTSERIGAGESLQT